MWTLIDVVDQVIHHESLGGLESSIFVLPSFTCSDVYDAPPFSLDGSALWDFFECVDIDLDIFVLYSLRTDYCMDMEV